MTKDQIDPSVPGKVTAAIPYEPWSLVIKGYKLSNVQNAQSAGNEWTPSHNILEAQTTPTLAILGGTRYPCDGKGKNEGINPQPMPMGVNAHYRTIHAWQKYGTKEPMIPHHIPMLPSSSQRQTTQPLVPYTKHSHPVANQSKQWLKDQGTKNPNLWDALLIHLDHWSQEEGHMSHCHSWRTKAKLYGITCSMDGFHNIGGPTKSKHGAQSTPRNQVGDGLQCWSRKLWDILWDMWDHCNKVLHSSRFEQQEITHSLVNQQITKYFAGGAQTLPRDVLHFLQTLKATVLQYPLASKQLWLESVVAVQKRWRHHKFSQYLGKQPAG